jgi:hypothetical protein
VTGVQTCALPILGPISFCEGDSVLLQVDSNYVAQSWNNGTTTLYTYADTSGNYFVNVTDTNGCSNRSNTINIDVRPNPVANFIVDGICANTPFDTDIMLTFWTS